MKTPTEVAAPAAVNAERTSNQAINKNCGLIRRNSTALNTLIHNTGLMVMRHADAYGDCTAAARLLDSMPKSHRRGLLARWFETYSSIIVENKGGEVKAHMAKAGAARHKPLDIDGATANPFYDLPGVDQEPGFLTLDEVMGNVISLKKRLQKKLDDGQVAAADVEAVTALVASLPATRTAAVAAA